MPDIDPNKTVFISYRRSVHKHLSLMLFKDLRLRGFDPFRDSDTMGAGEFEKIILNQIAARTHFVVLLSYGTLDRCADSGDWLRREIEHAIDLGRNIVPVLVDGFKFVDGEQYLKDKLSRLKDFQAQPLYTEEEELYNVGIDKPANQKLKLPDYTPFIEPVPQADKAKVEQIIEQAIEAPTPTQEELTAEQYFARALSKHEQEEWFEAIGDYSQAISLNPSYFLAYFNRGLVYSSFNLKQMIEDYDKAILLEPENAHAYNNRGVALASTDKLEDAIIDYSKAIKLKQNYVDAYNNRGRGYLIKGLYRNALADFNEGLQTSPDDIELYEIRGQAHFSLQMYEKAVLDFMKVRKENTIYTAGLAGLAISYQQLAKIKEARKQWLRLVNKDKNYKDAEWVKWKLNWAEAEAARRLISEL